MREKNTKSKSINEKNSEVQKTRKKTDENFLK